MLPFTNAFSSFSVDDLDKAQQFYAVLLQLKVSRKEYMLELEVEGAGKVLLYPKEDHQPASFTVLNFWVPDVYDAVKELKAMGIKFERYDLPDLKTDEHNVLTDKGMGIRTAWFCDPAGNILSVIQQLNVPQSS